MRSKPIWPAAADGREARPRRPIPILKPRPRSPMLAIWDKADQWHGPASRASDELMRSRRVLVSTPLVFIECGNAAARTPYSARVDALRQSFLLG
jgi:hypothetical protein